MATAREPDRPQPEINPLPQVLMAILGAARDIGGQAWDELAPSAGHGAAELASVLYRGDAFVQYGHSQNNENVLASSETSPATQQGIESQQVEQPTQGAEM